METSSTTGAIAAALAKAHIDIDNPELDGFNPHFKSRFATLAAVLNAVRKPLAAQGIALMQSVSIDDGRVAVTTSMIHSSGEWLRETMAFPMPGNANVQQAGGIVTYLRRYSVIALCGIVGDPHEDDDGEGDRQQREERKPEPRRETFKPEQAKGGKPAPAPAANPAPASKPGRPWPDAGTDDLRVKKVTKRDSGKTAAFCEAEDGSSAWVCIPENLVGSIAEGVVVEIDYAWNKAGFYEASRIKAIVREEVQP